MMKDFDKIMEDFNNFAPCLIKMEDNDNNFKKISHKFIFSYLLGYFSKNNINNNDFQFILNNYKNDNFNTNEFFSDIILSHEIEPTM